VSIWRLVDGRWEEWNASYTPLVASSCRRRRFTRVVLVIATECARRSAGERWRSSGNRPVAPGPNSNLKSARPSVET
jgi:hypothetical protein